MITKSQRKKLKKVLGKTYTSDVLATLKKKNITSRLGKAYSAAMIRNVMNGTAHSVIEAVIFETAEAKIAEVEKENKRRALILETKKTDALTSV